MLRDSMALVTRRLMKRFMTISVVSKEFYWIFWISALRIAPDDVANRDLLRDQSEPEETIGDALLGRNDVLGDRADRERRTVGGNGLDIGRKAGDGPERFGDVFTMRFSPLRCRAGDVDDLLEHGAVIAGEVAVGDVERIALGNLGR